MPRRAPARIAVLTLGCSKNTVDSEVLLRQLDANAFAVTADPDDADVLIVNTCGFIDAAKEESVTTVLRAARRKSDGKLRKLYVAGCLSERYRDELREQIPEVDRFFGVTAFREIVEELGGLYRRELLGERHLTTPAHYAWLKISEGCDNPCSFCAIPIMRGGHVSKPLPDVLAEARGLAAQGVKELILIGQDTTYYGLDTDGRRTLASLLDALADVEGIAWVRLMYAYPAHFPMDILPLLRERPTLCSYLDMPVQHIHDGVLRSMRRGITGARTRDLIARIRDAVPGITLRTTLITGYPGEDNGAFEELLRFVEETRFDRLGVFPYSVEDGTGALPLGDPIASTVKEERRARLMEAQSAISLAHNRAKIGTTLPVLIDRAEGEYLIGRSEADAPEVDGEVLIAGCGDHRSALIGSFASVTIDDATEYDLIGSLAR
jgi:ribosomal protein S12 methylthiotransferase